MPERIQLRRTKGWRMPANTVKVDRTTKWGNPFRVGETFDVTDDEGGPVVGTYVCQSAAEAVDHFRAYMDGFAAWDLREELAGLRGKNLACWCRPGAPCHADVLLELANSSPVPTGDERATGKNPAPQAPAGGAILSGGAHG